MFCRKCGTPNDENAYRCVNCGEVLRFAPDQPGSVKTYLVPAILVTLCCCVPFGIVAIVYAAQVNGKITSGNHDAALKTAKSAKTWTWVAFACGLAFYMLYALAFALPQIIGASNR